MTKHFSLIMKILGAIMVLRIMAIAFEYQISIPILDPILFMIWDLLMFLRKGLLSFFPQ